MEIWYVSELIKLIDAERKIRREENEFLFEQYTNDPMWADITKEDVCTEDFLPISHKHATNNQLADLKALKRFLSLHKTFSKSKLESLLNDDCESFENLVEINKTLDNLYDFIRGDSALAVLVHYINIKIINNKERQEDLEID